MKTSHFSSENYLVASVKYYKIFHRHVYVMVNDLSQVVSQSIDFMPSDMR